MSMATYQFGFEEERFEHSVSQNFQCIICANVLREPVMCRNNQHLFCRACITKHLENSQKCPTCMQDLSVDALCEAPRAITNFLSELKIRCDFFNRGCLTLVELGNLDKHVEKCGFAPAACSNEGCQLVVNQRDLLHHESAVCEQRRVKCHDYEDVRQEIDNVKETLAKMTEKLDSNFKAIQEKFESVEDKIQSQMTKLELISEQLSKEYEETDTNQKVIAVGGERSSDCINILNSVEMFDPSKGTWTYLQSMTESRQGASAFVYKNQIIVCGGWTLDFRDYPYQLTSMETIGNANQVTPSSTWKYIPAILPEKLSGFSTVVYNDSLIVIGGDEGDNSNSAISEVSLVHPYAIKKLTTMPRNVILHGAEIFDDKIVIVGGRTTTNITCNNVLMYDIKKSNCEELAPLPYPVQHMATVKWADNIVVIGGYNRDSDALDTVIVYNVKTQLSNMLPPMIYKRATCSAVVVDNTIIVMGGVNKSGGNILKSVERFSFSRYTWEELPSMHEERQ